MKVMIQKTTLVAALAISFLATNGYGAELASNAVEPASQTQATQTLVNDKTQYAEEMYRDVERFSDGAVTFKVRTVAVGRLSEVSNSKIGDLFARPTHNLVFDETRVHFTNGRFVAISPEKNLDDLLNTDLNTDIRDFATVGLPLELGIYRKLEVKTLLGDESRGHEAMEFCWHGQDHCIVVDGALLGLDNSVREIRKLRADGPSQLLYAESSETPQDKARSCKLIGTNQASWQVRMPPYSKSGKDAIGRNAWRIDVGSAEAKLHCRLVGAVCDMNATASTRGSTVETFLGRSGQCDHGSMSPDSGTQGKVGVFTGCSVGNPGTTAKYDVRIAGSGMAMEITRETAAFVKHENSAKRSDTCAYF